MQYSSKDVFYLLSDLADACADLSIAMRTWYVEHENNLVDGNGDRISASIQEMQSVIEKMRRP